MNIDTYLNSKKIKFETTNEIFSFIKLNTTSILNDLELNKINRTSFKSFLISKWNNLLKLSRLDKYREVLVFLNEIDGINDNKDKAVYLKNKKEGIKLINLELKKNHSKLKIINTDSSYCKALISNIEGERLSLIGLPQQLDIAHISLIPFLLKKEISKSKDIHSYINKLNDKDLSCYENLLLYTMNYDRVNEKTKIKELYIKHKINFGRNPTSKKDLLLSITNNKRKTEDEKLYFKINNNLSDGYSLHMSSIFGKTSKYSSISNSRKLGYFISFYEFLVKNGFVDKGMDDKEIYFVISNLLSGRKKDFKYVIENIKHKFFREKTYSETVVRRLSSLEKLNKQLLFYLK